MIPCLLPTRLITCLAAAIVSMATALAAPYQKAEKVEGFSANDQHGESFTLDPAGTRFLLVSHDMTTGKKANAALSALGKDYLPNHKAVYLANIHGMPGIGRTFALPKMRKYEHRIILGDDANLIARFPESKDKVTILKLTHGKVSDIAYWDPAADQIDSLLK